MGETSFLEEKQEINGKEEEKDLKILAKLCDNLKKGRKTIAYLEDQLRVAKEFEKKLSQEEIPNLLLSKGISSLSLDDGLTVSINESIKVSLPKKDLIKRANILKWIIENGGANIIKRELTIEEPSIQTISILKKNAVLFEDKKNIHASTLKAWFKSKLGMSKNSLQEIEIGDVPKEANLFLYKETKIK